MRKRRMMRDLTGKVFGYWTVLHKVPMPPGRTYSYCRCRCGTERRVRDDRLLNGDSKSCGCYHRQVVSRKEPVQPLTAKLARKLLRYNPRTGEFRWRVPRPNGVRPGDLAGSVSNEGYLRIAIEGKRYVASRVIWLMMTGSWPEREIDHRDLDKLNNRWRNLRQASDSDNMANTRGRSRTGFKGVYESGRHFAAQIRKGRLFHLGTYSTAQEAHAAYMRAARKIHGEFARAA